MKGQIQSCACDSVSFYAVDIERNLRGMIKEFGAPDQDLYPIKIQDESLEAMLVQAANDNPDHLRVSFQYDVNEKDELQRIYPGNLTIADLLRAKGLIDVFSAYSDVTTTGFTVKLKTLYSQGEKYNVPGLLIGDFDLYNETDAAAITITSVTEVSPGEYDFVISTTPTSDVKRLTPTKTGFDFTKVVENTFTTGA